MSAITHAVLASYRFLPSDIGNMVAWYRTDQGITISTGVSQWNDLSGNSRHLLQATGGNQPTFGATSGANSQPGVTFPGSPQFMASSTFGAIAQPYHTFAIMKTTNVSDVNSGYVTGGAIGERIFEGNGVSVGVSTYFGTTGVVFPHSDLANFYLWESLANNASSSIVRGNGTIVNGTVGTNTLTGVTLGKLAGNPTYGKCVISEVVIYNAAITGVNLALLRRYFAQRYAVATN